MGRTMRAATLKAASLSARLDEYENKLLRQADRQKRTVERRDRKIAALTADLLAARGQKQATPERPFNVDRRTKRTARLLVSRERALISACQRARHMESQNANHHARTRQLELAAPRALRIAEPGSCPGANACELQLPPRRVLYLGGRPSVIDRLKSIAREANTEMFHHDGGLEQTVDLIDGLVTRCDAVFGPIDCVSHGAREGALQEIRETLRSFAFFRRIEF